MPIPTPSTTSSSLRLTNFSMATLRRTCPPGTRIIRRNTDTITTRSNSTVNSSLYQSRTSTASSAVSGSSRSTSSPMQSSWFSTQARKNAYKGDQDRESLKPGSQEYSKSGGDDAAAHESDAFDPSKTRPESETSDTDKGSLDVTPGNVDVSKGKDAEKTERASGTSEERERTSGGSTNL
ncbi:hypothetical protein EJ08DRAFT_646743 [Tothia fuscella]|uniref:Uncharacterized protein n=1 Tax=Tothia fuscella TaxID=1048955 RepID=A0A9P4NZ45_9PEZI|nr:hypothetical protein EJ08DRAFT_646743 [Tothia fuscella]